MGVWLRVERAERARLLERRAAIEPRLPRTLSRLWQGAAMTLRVCSRCGRPKQPATVCPVCGPTRRQMTTTQRGYDGAHRKNRASLIKAAIGMPCPLCGETMRDDQDLHLDHTVPASLGGRVGDRVVHAWCNESSGNRAVA